MYRWKTSLSWMLLAAALLTRVLGNVEWVFQFRVEDSEPLFRRMSDNRLRGQ